MRNDATVKRHPNRHHTARHSDPGIGSFRLTTLAMPRPLPAESRDDSLARGIIRLRRARRGDGRSGSGLV